MTSMAHKNSTNMIDLASKTDGTLADLSPMLKRARSSSRSSVRPFSRAKYSSYWSPFFLLSLSAAGLRPRGTPGCLFGSAADADECGKMLARE